MNTSYEQVSCPNCTFPLYRRQVCQAILTSGVSPVVVFDDITAATPANYVRARLYEYYAVPSRPAILLCPVCNEVIT